MLTVGCYEYMYKDQAMIDSLKGLPMSVNCVHVKKTEQDHEDHDIKINNVKNKLLHLRLVLPSLKMSARNKY